MNLQHNIAIRDASHSRHQEALALSRQLQLPIKTLEDSSIDFFINIDDEKISLIEAHSKNKPIYIDFFSPGSQKRLQSALIKKAVGLKKTTKLSVLDLTAGLGRDAFALTYFGCDVTMIERSLIMATLLDDGLKRAKEHPQWDANWKLTLIQQEAKCYLESLTHHKPEVIYMDPMFAKANKSAKSKKELQALQKIITDADDSEALFALARNYYQKRLVVKRAIKAPPISGLKPDVQYLGTTIRFDVYF